MISIVVPLLDEEKVLCKNYSVFTSLEAVSELIFVDGGSSDKSIEIAAALGKVLSCENGRARQMNEGARQAAGDILFFLHADSSISTGTIDKIEKEMRETGDVGGCLTQRIENERSVFRFIEWQGNNRARRTKVFYGDQGIFVRKDVFDRIGGFPDVPIFEDVLFTQKLRKEGKTMVLPDKITVSARRWDKRGIIRTTMMYNILIVMFKLGYPLERIKRLYEDLR